MSRDPSSSRGKRQQRRRDERAAHKEQAAKQRNWTLPQAAAELGDEDVPAADAWLDPDHRGGATSPDADVAQIETLLDPSDPDVQKFAKTGMRSSAGKWDMLRPVVVGVLRDYLRDADVCEPYDRLLRSHPGVPSPLTVEGLFLTGLMSAWADASFLLTDFTTHLGALPPEIAAELGAVTRDGTPGAVYRTIHKQFTRFLEVLNAEGTKEGESFDTNWLERKLIPPSIPHDFLQTVEAVAVDETASLIWHAKKCKASQKKVNKKVKKIFRKRHPYTAVPKMSSPVMREIAAEIGIPIGEDGRIERTSLNKAARQGYRTPTEKQPDSWYVGFGVFSVHATRTFTLARNKDDATLGPPVRSYVLAVTIRPANADAGPVGHELVVRIAGLCPMLEHVYADQAFSRKIRSFTVLLRRLGIQVHMRLPRDGSDKPKTVLFQRGDGSMIQVKEFRGVFYHRFTPNAVFKQPYEKRKDWMYVVNNYDGPCIRFQCPFANGKIANRNLPNFKGNPSARLVKIPKGATSCCDGICTIVASPQELARYQMPHHDSKAHAKIMGNRNPVEGGYGTVKTQGGFDPMKCRLPEQEPHALRALFLYVVRNLQTTLNDEFAQVRARMKAQRAAKQTRRSEEAARKKKQNPNDLPHITEPDSRDGLDGDDDPSDDDPADEPSAAALTPPRAPP